ncbi:hypothetical protein B0H19DRAFT_143054 [Mycena capillaripes]|nr:hypothetical protein B0H19DRAFT_143054 [Mycena capillaripes]
MNADDIRVEDLWFSSDTLVIRAEKRIFRVSRSVLTARSSVFSNMIAFPQPVDAEREGIIDGSPVVTLLDSGQEVEVFLRAIFDSSYFMPPPEPVELNAVLGILRLAHKYDVRYLYLRALKHLSIPYGPSSLEEYCSSGSQDYIIYDSDEHLRFFSIIRAATEVGALWLLPIPYYLAAKHTRVTLRSKIQLGAQEHAVQTCLAAQVDLHRATVKLSSLFSTASDRSDPGCKDRKNCNDTKDGYNAVILEALWKQPCISPLEMWADATTSDGWFSPSWLAQHICDHCLTQAKARQAEILQGVWNDLPGMFNLPSWEELRAKEVTDLGETR